MIKILAKLSEISFIINERNFEKFLPTILLIYFQFLL